MHALAQFPSQGDLIKFTYDALGIIPNKSEQILDLKIENKSLQKSLQRFAKEENSNFLENFDLHMQALHSAIADLFPTWHLQHSILDTLKDLWNVDNWLKDKTLPAFAMLKATFDRAFKSHAIPKERQESYLFFLLIARFCTYCSQQVKENYGTIFLKIISEKLRSYLDIIYKDFQIFYNDEMKSIMNKQKNIMALDPYNIENNVNIEEMANFLVFQSFQKNCLQAGAELALHVQYVGHANDLPDFNDHFPVNFNLITLKDNFRYLQSQANPKLFLANIENYHHGYFDVLSNKISFDTWFESYKACKNDIVYPWLEQWIRGVILFKKNQSQEALEFMDKAFETIRYAAGKHQECFLEDYLLISLANPKGYKSFKQAYKWGTFMNHFGGLKPLFNLESDEEIKQLYQAKKDNFNAFEKMKNNMDMRTLAKMVFHWQYDDN